MPEVGLPINPLVILFAAIFTNNILLSNYLGMCSFLSVSSQVKASWGLGAAVIFVMAVTSGINWLVYYYLLMPLNLHHFWYIIFIIVIAAFVQLVEIIIEKTSPVLHINLGIFLPLITVNCAILGASLFVIIRNYDFLQALAFGFGGGVGWAMALVAMAGIRQKIARANIPPALEGAGIALIIAGLMSFAVLGFSGMVQVQ
ncbi:MAG: Rnf-Nqr domain containing protein [Candidatus Lernaella stagnicola]|nr:Rnf-Nqr domain containing protein [Candidatus Lernaella stagnicola]